MIFVPKVTVIIPTYNRARYLGEAIRSVLDQTFRDFELIVVDDGSIDGTATLVAEFDDQRVRYHHQPHRGISAALNAGIRAARGQYVARLDSDDRWLPEMLATLVPVLDGDSEVGVAYAKGQAMDSSGRLLAHTQGLPQRFPGESLRTEVYDDCTCNVALVARSACFDRVGFYDEALIANEDWDMWLRVARHYRFVFVDKVVALVRWHEDNLTGLTSPNFAVVLDTRTIPLDKLFRDPDLPPAVRAMAPVAYTNVHLFCGQRWLQAWQFRRAAREFAKAVRVSNRPVTTAVRAAWLAGAVPMLRRFALGRRVVDALAEWRRRQRAGR